MFRDATVTDVRIIVPLSLAGSLSRLRGRSKASGNLQNPCTCLGTRGPARAGVVMAPAACATLQVYGKLMNGVRAYPAGAGARYAA